MVQDEDEIATEARRLVKERAFSARQFLSLLDRGFYTDIDLAAVSAAERDLLLSALRAMVDQPDGIVRLGAAQALAHFEEPRGWEVLIECLLAEEAALRRKTLERLGFFGIRERVESPDASIDPDALLAALEFSLDDSTPWVREQAVCLIGYLATPRAFDRLVGLLDDVRADVRTHAACILGDAGHDRGALRVIEEQLRTPGQPQQYRLIRALEHLCNSAKPETRTRAAAVAIDFVRGNLADRASSALDANLLANDIWHCMDGIAAASSKQDWEALQESLRQVFREVLASKVEWWVRGKALRRLAQLEGQAGITRLVDALQDPDLRKDAIEGLTSLAKGADDADVLEALAKEIQREDANYMSALVKAFIEVGGDAKALAHSVVSRIDPEVATTVRWLLRDIGPAEVAVMLQAACGDVPAGDVALEKLDADWQEKPDATHIILGLLSEWQRLTCVFYKTVDGTVDHAETVCELAAIAGTQFAVDDVVQTIESDGDLRVLLVHRGAGYAFPVQNHGRWCNVPAVIDGLNGILDRLGHAERFIEMESGTSDVALVTFVRADVFMPLASDLGIRLGRSG